MFTFGSSKEEIKSFLIGPGQVTFNASDLSITDYPFEPSIAFKDVPLPASFIQYVSLDWMPAFRVGNELIFLHATAKEQLQYFAISNRIEIFEPPRIWSWILEPFLDTEFTEERSGLVTGLLARYGLTSEDVTTLRREVKEQMLKFNFDTTLWEFIDLELFDVLCAMRPKYSKAEFHKFYWRAMEIALRPGLNG